MSSKLHDKIIALIEAKIEEHFQSKMKEADARVDKLLQEITKKSHDDFIVRQLAGHIEQIVKQQGNRMLNEEIAKASRAYMENMPNEAFSKQNLYTIADNLIAQGILEAYIDKQYQYLKATLNVGGNIYSQLKQEIANLKEKVSKLEDDLLLGLCGLEDEKEDAI